MSDVNSTEIVWRIAFKFATSAYTSGNQLDMTRTALRRYGKNINKSLFKKKQKALALLLNNEDISLDKSLGENGVAPKTTVINDDVSDSDREDSDAADASSQYETEESDAHAFVDVFQTNVSDGESQMNADNTVYHAYREEVLNEENNDEETQAVQHRRITHELLTRDVDDGVDKDLEDDELWVDVNENEKYWVKVYVKSVETEYRECTWLVSQFQSFDKLEKVYGVSEVIVSTYKAGDVVLIQKNSVDAKYFNDVSAAVSIGELEYVLIHRFHRVNASMEFCVSFRMLRPSSVNVSSGDTFIIDEQLHGECTDSANDIGVYSFASVNSSGSSRAYNVHRIYGNVSVFKTSTDRDNFENTIAMEFRQFGNPCRIVVESSPLIEIRYEQVRNN